jgi:hypothetical protein
MRDLLDASVNSKEKRFVVCIRNEGYEVSLERRKLYATLPDPAAAKHRLLRVIDESGEDYLYPEDFFLPLGLPEPVEKALLAVS